MTTDHAEALDWFARYPVAGIERLVVKGRATRYMPGAREWVKVRARHAAEAVVGGVLGPVDAPEALVL